MDESRFQELERKKLKTGLTRQEADELGRMYAEKKGEPYSNAEQQREGADQEVREGTPVTQDEVEEFQEVKGQQSKEA